jgi:hypothetical protein
VPQLRCAAVGLIAQMPQLRRRLLCVRRWLAAHPCVCRPSVHAASRTQSRGKAEPPALAIQAQVPEKKPPLTVAQRVARLFIWAGHICLIASLWAMVLGQPESGLARLIIVAPLFYLVGVAMKAVLFTAGVLGQKNLTE